MASAVEAQLILCDAAQADPTTGKVHMLGAGWSLTRSPTTHAVVVLLKIPWDRTNQKIPLRLTLLTQDGLPVEMPTPSGKSVNLQAGGEIEAGRPAGLSPGSLIDASFALNVPALPLKPGRYEWRLELDGREDHKVAPFTVVG